MMNDDDDDDDEYFIGYRISITDPVILTKS
jgi:hypothetical protein